MRTRSNSISYSIQLSHSHPAVPGKENQWFTQTKRIHSIFSKRSQAIPREKRRPENKQSVSGGIETVPGFSKKSYLNRDYPKETVKSRRRMIRPIVHNTKREKVLSKRQRAQSLYVNTQSTKHTPRRHTEYTPREDVFTIMNSLESQCKSLRTMNDRLEKENQALKGKIHRGEAKLKADLESKSSKLKKLQEEVKSSKEKHLLKCEELLTKLNLKELKIKEISSVLPKETEEKPVKLLSPTPDNKPAATSECNPIGTSASLSEELEITKIALNKHKTDLLAARTEIRRMRCEQKVQISQGQTTKVEYQKLKNENILRRIEVESLTQNQKFLTMKLETLSRAHSKRENDLLECRAVTETLKNIKEENDIENEKIKLTSENIQTESRRLKTSLLEKTKKISIQDQKITELLETISEMKTNEAKSIRRLQLLESKMKRQNFEMQKLRKEISCSRAKNTIRADEISTLSEVITRRESELEMTKQELNIAQEQLESKQKVRKLSTEDIQSILKQNQEISENILKLVQ